MCFWKAPARYRVMSESNIPEQFDPETVNVKIPPHSKEAEQSVLGGLMLNNEAWEYVGGELSDSDFYHQEHRHIFRAIQLLANQNQPFDVVTLHDQLKKQNLLDRMGGLVYLSDLARNTPSVANIHAYTKIVLERATLRRLINASQAIGEAAYNPKERSVSDVLQDAERRIFEIAEMRPQQGGPQPLAQILPKVIDRIDALFQSPNALTGLSTGFSDLDTKTNGLQPADLIIVAGRPSMGKTTFAMNLVEHAILSSDKSVLVYSLEMPADSLITRMLSSLGRIDQTLLRSGRLTEEDWPRLTSAINLLNDRKLFIDDTAGITPAEMRARTRRIVREHGSLAMIMVDYLQLMQVGGSGSENRTNEISEISRSLKALAKEFNCPVVALSQLNRSLEQRPDKRPKNADLRESGAIEQDADVIMFVYRDEVYHETSEHKGIAEIIIGKQRNGPLGTVRLAFLGQYTRFENLAANAYANYPDD